MFQDNSNTAAVVVEEAAEVSGLAYSSVERLWNAFAEQIPNILAGIIVLAVFWIIGRIVKRIFLAASGKTELDDRSRILLSRLLVVVFSVIGIFAALTIIIPSFGFGDLLAGLGFSSFIIGFATKDILNNFFSGILVLWRRTFKVGDYVVVKNHEGEVEQIGVRATSLRTYDGERVLVPNGEMYSSSLVIFDAGTTRRLILKISVSYKSNIKTVKEIIHRVLFEAEGVENDPKPNVFVTDLTTEGVNLSIYFWIMTEKNSPIAVFDDIATEIKESLNESAVTLYPPTVAVLKEKEDLKEINEEEAL